MRSVSFTVEATAGEARAGTLELARGTVQTPVYMPVGTQGAIRTLSPLHLADTGTQILLANTYHLSQRPGADLVAKHGGLHGFMQVDKPILTDSGGFQVFSLDKEVTEDGVTFQYEVDGKKTFLSPEVSMDIQQKLGADIAMVFDECLAYGTEKHYAEDSVNRTARWEARCKVAHTREDQSLFGIVQGGFWPDLRKQSAEQIQEIGFDGYAIGGLSVGEGHSLMCEVLDMVLPHMQKQSPRYLMGVGRPLDLVEGVARGVDMFDCVIQTRHARSGTLYTSQGRIRVTDKRYRHDMYPIDASCSCYTCRTFTRAYLNHLFRVGEVLGATLCTIHNIAWFHQFMGNMRQSIIDGTFEDYRKWVHEVYPDGSPADPEGKHEKQKRARSNNKRRGGRKRR
ncbi:MAG: tRNA guanosine(34) transglycosylase Tgt [Deltaproteobacteria bacterium]|nr:MAG: tRNA guanosine(34) transglycosylase Tgt [Deltaproteobacteria bacterium]